MKHHKKIILVTMVGIATMQSSFIQANDNDFVIVPSYITESSIDGDALSGASGAIGVNMVAGDDNLQANAAAIAISPNGLARTHISSHQATAIGQATAPDSSIAGIRDNAFANSTGILSINQISGGSNVQANGVSFAYGLEVTPVTDAALAQEVTGNTTDLSANGLDKSSLHIADIEATAFENSRGIVQINQTAGSGNATRNNFALRISAAAK